jgi:tight adherence protein B
MDQGLLTLVLLAVLLLSAGGLYLIGRWIYRNSALTKGTERVSRFVTTIDTHKQQKTDQKSGKVNNLVSSLRKWINKSLSNISSEDLQQKLSSAYWPITDTEFILLRIAVVVFGFFFGWLVSRNLLGGLFLAVLALMVPPMMLDRAITNRQRNFANQLLDVLVLIKGAVQAGYGLMQSFDLAVKEMPAPSSEEFSRVIREVRYGISLEDALNNLSKRMENDDLQIVITAIIINTQVGGNLSTVLESTISTIRDRMQLLGEIRSLTSYSRYVANLLSLLPIITGVAIFLISRDYYDPVKTSLIAQIGLGIALLMVVLGNIWLRRLVKINV